MMICKVCNHSNIDDALFCNKCGNSLLDETDIPQLEYSIDENEDRVREKLRDKFRLISTLGSGGMGIVFEALDLDLDRRIALKLLPLQHAHDENIVARFKREAQVAARLNHPHIIPVHSVGSVEHLHFFTMSFMEGGSLATKMAEGLRVDESVGIIKQVASALDYAHKKGVIHRDIKPENIMFDEHGSSKVMDFGIAKALYKSNLTATKAFLGTPQYTSPEQAVGKGIDGRSDLYALGVVFFEMVTGVPPFWGDDPLSTIYQHVNEKPPDPAKLQPDISSKVSSTILKLLAKDPADRFQSGAELMASLEDSTKAVTSTKSLGTPVVRRVLEEDTSLLEAQAISKHGQRTARTKSKMGAILIFAVLATLLLAVLDWRFARTNGKGVVEDEGEPTLVTPVPEGQPSLPAEQNAPQEEPLSPTEQKTPREEPPTKTEPGEAALEDETSEERDSEADRRKAQVLSIMEQFDFVNIPEGTFKMGSRTQMEKDARHVHKVFISSFFLSKTEVTQELWSAVMLQNPSCTKGERLPVENVSWKDAQGFIEKLGKIGIGRFRLPTEAEWEYACRAGGGSAPSVIFGGDALAEKAWYVNNASSRSHEVGQKKPNDWGLFDMNGNVWEWCQDWYAVDYYKNSPLKNPGGPSSGTRRVMRGGSWNAELKDCRPTKRSCKSPDRKSCRTGFRLVKENQ